jgi:hypothetical protein
MISFTLQCANDHQFDSWFTSSTAYATLAQAGHLNCPVCGDGQIEKALMAPAVAIGDSAATKPAISGALGSEDNPVAAAMAQMRREVEENSDYVGLNFAAEARAMHLGDMPARPIYGEAKTQDARALIEDGIPVAPLPFLPRQKTN